MSRKRKADTVDAADSEEFCRGVLRNEARIKARIKELEEEVSRLQPGLGDPDVVVDRLRENLHHAGDFSIVRRALQPNARRLRGKVRTLVLLDQAPESPAASTVTEEKRGVDARVATTWSPRKRGVGSAYNSAASDAGEESAGDTEDEKIETETASTRSQEKGKK